VLFTEAEITSSESGPEIEMFFRDYTLIPVVISSEFPQLMSVGQIKSDRWSKKSLKRKDPLAIAKGSSPISLLLFR